VAAVQQRRNQLQRSASGPDHPVAVATQACHTLPPMKKRCYITCAGLVLSTALPAVQGQQLQETIQLQESVSDTAHCADPGRLHPWPR